MKRHQRHRLSAVEIIGTDPVLNYTFVIEANKLHCWLFSYVYNYRFANNPSQIELLLLNSANFSHFLLLVVNVSWRLLNEHEAFDYGLPG